MAEKAAKFSAWSCQHKFETSKTEKALHIYSSQHATNSVDFFRIKKIAFRKRGLCGSLNSLRRRSLA